MNVPIVPHRQPKEIRPMSTSNESDKANQPNNRDVGDQSVVVASVPVDVASKIANEMIIEALSGRGRFAMNHPDGNTYTRWGMVGREIQKALEEASEGQTIVWNGQFEPENERRVRLFDERCRDWPEPAKSEAISILANGCV